MQIDKVIFKNVAGQVTFIAEDLIWKKDGIRVYSNKKVEDYQKDGIAFSDGSSLNWKKKTITNKDDSTYIQVFYEGAEETVVRISGKRPPRTVTMDSGTVRLENCQVGVIGDGVAVVGKIEF